MAKVQEVTIRIPKDVLNPKVVKRRVIVNGVYYDIKVGEDVKVPIFVKEILDKNGALG